MDEGGHVIVDRRQLNKLNFTAGAKKAYRIIHTYIYSNTYNYKHT